MSKFSTEQIRNVCILGNGNSGKTTVAESMLKFSDAIERRGAVLDGNTISDYDPEEVKRKISINTSLLTFEFGKCKFNVLDTPGSYDFIGEMLEAVRVSDAAVIVVSGKSGVSAGVERAWELCNSRNLPRIVFVNKVDDERCNYRKVLSELRESFGKTVAPFQLPINNGEKIIGFVDVVSMRGKLFQDGPLLDTEIPSDMLPEIEPIRNMIIESVAETDEELMDRYFSGDEFTIEEIKKALRKGIDAGDIVPVICGTALHNKGVGVLLEDIDEYFPSPMDVEDFKYDSNGKPSVFIFKTIADPFVGKLSFFKVMSGTVKGDTTLTNLTNGTPEKLGKIYTMFGKKQNDVDELCAGDIGAVAKLTTAKTGDTLAASADMEAYEPIVFPIPNMSLAILPKAKGDEEKISTGLQKLMEEDGTFKVENNHETHQTIISGVGEVHIDVIKSKLKSKFGTETELEEPRVPYREKLKKPVKVEGKHKKQSGGHGQYGHVWIEFSPTEEEDLIFEEKIFGGSVPKNFFPAVEKGLKECILNGSLAGYPVVGLKAVLVDGSYHPVDSSEMAFKVAASLAFKKAMDEGGVQLLEPIGRLNVTVPSNLMGDITGDINKRRGRVLGMNPGEKYLVIDADVPMSEMHRYATDLRSMTQGRGSFRFAFERYEIAPHDVEQKVVSESNKE